MDGHRYGAPTEDAELVSLMQLLGECFGAPADRFPVWVDQVGRENLRTITVTGGVACNRRLRERMQADASARGLRAVFPSPKYCTDNAAMIAGQGWHHFRAGRLAALDIDAIPR